MCGASSGPTPTARRTPREARGSRHGEPHEGARPARRGARPRRGGDRRLPRGSGARVLGRRGRDGGRPPAASTSPTPGPACCRSGSSPASTSVRLHARWVSIAPGTNALTMPAGFHPTDPNDPKYDWGRLDSAVKAVRAAGMRVELTVTGSGPAVVERLAARATTRAGSRSRSSSPRSRRAVARALRRRRSIATCSGTSPTSPGWLQPQEACVRGRLHPGRAAPLPRRWCAPRSRRSRPPTRCRRC